MTTYRLPKKVLLLLMVKKMAHMHMHTALEQCEAAKICAPSIAGLSAFAAMLRFF